MELPYADDSEASTFSITELDEDQSRIVLDYIHQHLGSNDDIYIRARVAELTNKNDTNQVRAFAIEVWAATNHVGSEGTSSDRNKVD